MLPMGELKNLTGKPEAWAKHVFEVINTVLEATAGNIHYRIVFHCDHSKNRCGFKQQNGRLFTDV